MVSYRNYFATVVFVWDINKAGILCSIGGNVAWTCPEYIAWRHDDCDVSSAWHTILAVVHLFCWEIKTKLDFQLGILSCRTCLLCSLRSTLTDRDWCYEYVCISKSVISGFKSAVKSVDCVKGPFQWSFQQVIIFLWTFHNPIWLLDCNST